MRTSRSSVSTAPSASDVTPPRSIFRAEENRVVGAVLAPDTPEAAVSSRKATLVKKNNTASKWPGKRPLLVMVRAFVRDRALLWLVR